MDTDPKLVGPSADRMAEERQYLRNDAVEAIGAFRRRREENVEYLRKLTPAQWDKGGIHPVRGRMTIDTFLTLMAWHDDNHLDQLEAGARRQGVSRVDVAAIDTRGGR